MNITLYEVNWLLSGFVLGAVTAWGISLIIRLHFRKEYEDEKSKGEITGKGIETQREIKGIPSGKGIVQDC